MSSTPKKTKYSHYKNNYKSHNKLYLEAGQCGFLATCNFREKDCVRECYNILNEYADALYGAESETMPAPVDVDTNNDIADDLQKEIVAATEKSKHIKKDALKMRRFQVVDTGTTNCVFIRTTLPEPSKLGERIVNDIARSRIQKSRFLLRLVPIEAVCRAKVTDIVNACGALFDKHFLRDPTTFSIVFNRRYNNDVKRENIIHELADLVQSKNAGNRVDLKQADKTVVVEVIKGLCCVGVVTQYLQNKKYNLLELANVKSAGEDEDKKTDEITSVAQEEIDEPQNTTIEDSIQDVKADEV